MRSTENVLVALIALAHVYFMILEMFPAELQRAESERAREILQEVKEGCTHAMLACLDRPARAAFVLGGVLAMKSPDAACWVAAAGNCGVSS